MMTKESVAKIEGRKATRTEILGIPVDVVTFAEAMEVIHGYLEGLEPRIIATADAAGIVISQSNSAYRSLLLSADLVTPDSVGVLWAGKRSGSAFSERVSGVDLVDALCQLSANKGYRIFLLGSAPGIADQAAERLRLKHPGCNIVGSRHGYFPAEDDEIVAQEIQSFHPDILFVAMGIPRQELFIAKTAKLIGAKVNMGVGGSLDVFSGSVKRAPKLVQKLSLEWLWRTLANPKKIAKAKNLPVFFWKVITSKK